MKKFIIAFFAGLAITCIVVSNHFKTVESALADSVLRLHVIANSDSYDDQALKLKVRDAVIENTKDIFSVQSDICSAKQSAAKNLGYIKKIAEDEIKKNGFDYKADVTFGKSEFPTKIYNNITLPSGTYQALKIVIGNGEGKNWWCVMYPPLCFTDGTTKMDKESKAILKKSLTKEEYNLVMTKKQIPVKVKFKLYEIWQSGKKFTGNVFKKLK